MWIYSFLPRDRPELATDPRAWTDDDRRIGAEHHDYLERAAAQGVVVMAGRSQDGIGPAIVILDVATYEEAERFMEADPFVANDLFGASLHPFRIALHRDPGGVA